MIINFYKEITRLILVRIPWSKHRKMQKNNSNNVLRPKKGYYSLKKNCIATGYPQGDKKKSKFWKVPSLWKLKY